MGRSKKEESVVESVVESVATASPVDLRAFLVVADSPVKAKLIADMMPEATFNCDRAGLAGASEALAKRPGWTLFVIRGTKAIEVVKG